MSPVAAVAGALTSGSYAAGWALVRGLPEPVARALFQAGADLAAARGGGSIDRLRANLERVAPGQDLLRDAVRSYARYWCEAFRLPSMSRDRIVEGTRTTGEQLLRDSVASGRGTVMVLPHSGNWDAAGAWCGLTGVPFTTVAERLKPESVYERFVAFRQSLGMEVLPLTGGDRPPYDVLTERLRAGGTLCLLADRDLTVRGVDVDFFGATARMPAGPARLALETGADLLPVTLSFAGDRDWDVLFHPYVEPTDLATMTQAVATAFEAGIAAHPADWHMLQRLWLDDLAPD
ncbi:MAG: phosphatidylinositol mannoside acyltransferase, partial [Mycobacteriales bacterium]